MNSRSARDRRTADESVRADRDPVGVWPTRVDEQDAVELLGLDGSVTRVVALPDGGLEIHTDGLTAGGRAIRVPPTGPARIIDC